MRSNRARHSALLLCLSRLTEIYGRAKSPAALAAGLPDETKGSEIGIFIQAAERIGLKAQRHEKRPAHQILPEVLPCILLCKAGWSCILLEKESDRLKIWNPETGNEEIMSAADIQNRETGEIILVKPLPSFISRELGENASANQRQWFKQIFYANKSIYKKVIIASLLINSFALAGPIYIMNVYDRVIPNNAIETGWALAIGVLIVFSFDFIIRMLRGYFIDFSGRNIDIHVTRKLFDQVLDMKLAHRPASSGAYANMLREFDAVRDFLTSATLVAVVDLPFSLLFILVIFILAKGIGGIVLGLMALSVVLSLAVQIPLAKHIRNATRASEIKHGLLVETINGLEGIKAMNADRKIRARYGAYVSQSASEGQMSRYYSALAVNISTYVQQISVILIVLVGMYMIADLKLLTGALIACVMLSGRALSPVTQVANLMSRYHQAKQGLQRLDQIMSADIERPANQDFLYRAGFDGQIDFDNVCFTYPETARQVLNNVSFSIAAGERVGIIGKIGSGKSTLARLMIKLYEPDSGAVLFDQTDIRHIDPVDLRNNVGYIAQEATLLRGTVRDNITMSRPHATEEEITAASRAASAHDFIGLHPMGYDMPVGERGEGLSGGQKQCIALARAFLMQPNIFICDEPTNAMDMQSETNFMQIMRDQTAGKTFILVTHRAHLLSLVDRLILIDKGKIIADGPRDQVLNAISNPARTA